MLHFGEKRCLVVLEDADSYKIEAYRLNDRGETLNAVRTLRDGLRVYPQEPCLHQALAHQLIRIAEDKHFLTDLESDEIFGCFETAFMLVPNERVFAIDYARALRKTERFEESEEILLMLYNDEKPSDPDNIQILSQLAKLYEAAGQEEWAACCYYGCTQIVPKDSKFSFELSKLEIENGIDIPTEADWLAFMDYAQDVVDNAQSWGVTIMLEAQELERAHRTRIRPVRTRNNNLDELDLIL